MELVERYLQAVKMALPKAQREDVLRELSDEILSQVEEKESALGRPLTVDEQAALLQRIGHPALVASRYRKQQYLIGPALFPIYWMVLRLILIIVLFVTSLSAVIVAATGGGFASALGKLASLPMAAIGTFAWVTITFAIADYFQAKFDFFGRWDARTLPKLSKIEKRPSTFEAAAGLFFSTIFGVWWLVGLKHQFWIFGPGVFVVHFGPVWQTLYPLFVALVIVSVVRATIDVVRPGWEKAKIIFTVFFRLANLAVLLFFLNAEELIVAADASNPQLQQAVNGINRVAHLCVIVAIVMTVAQAAWDVYRYFFRDRKNGQQAAVGL